MFAMRKSLDSANGGIQAHILRDEFNSESPTAMRKNLKTAGGVGLANLSSELLAKDIVYKASLDSTSAVLSKNP